MRFPRPDDVPFTSGVSGVVFVLAVFKFGSTTMLRDEGVILGAWGLMYLVEWAYRAARRGRASRLAADVPADASTDLPAGRTVPERAAAGQ